MHKLKHGDRVTCEIDGTKIDDARISVDRDRYYFICQNVISGPSTQNRLGYKYAWHFNPEDPEDDNVTNLTVIPRTLDDLMVGDVVQDVYGDTQTILARIENLVALDDSNRFSEWLSIYELKEADYTLVQSIEEPIEELTMEEVCKRLGKQVKIKK